MAATGTGPALPAWTSKEEKRGVDPLGMQNTSVALYQQLLPGVSNVTLRMRYYGFYCWLAHHYAHSVRDTSQDRWCRYLRRAEALYALVAQANGGERGVAGTQWASKLLAQPGAEVIFHPGTDREDGQVQYLKQKFGAFGAAYGSQLFEVGLLVYGNEHGIPLPSSSMGEQLATAFQEAIGDSAALFLQASAQGRVNKSELLQMNDMLPSHIGQSSAERELYQMILFGESGAHDGGPAARRRTLRLALHVADTMRVAPGAYEVRWALYAAQLGSGMRLPHLGDDEASHQFAWCVYHANDMLHVCYEALLKFALDVLESSRSGLTPAHLVDTVVFRLQQAIHARSTSSCWNELVRSVTLAEDPWAEDSSEYALLEAILGEADIVGYSMPEWAAQAITLLAVLHKRFAPHLARIARELPVVATQPYLQSLTTELAFLQANGERPLADLLSRLFQQRIIDRHLWVALQKFRAAGDYTFLLESDEGRLRVRRKDVPVLTNPRLSSALTFLQDIHLLDEEGPTPMAHRLLEAA